MLPKIIRACTISYSMDLIEDMIPALKEHYEVLVLSSPGPELDEVETKYGVRGIRIPMMRHISLIRDIKSLRDLVITFRKEKPTLVHSMTPKAGLLCMVAAWIARVPVRVHTFTGLVFPTTNGLKRKVLMFTDWLTCLCATHIIPEGEGVKNDLLNNNLTRKPIRVLGYGNVKGVDMKRFSLRPEVLEQARKIKNPNVFVFVFVGRIVGDKGINELVAAFSRINEKYSSTQLILVGPYEDDLDPITEESRQTIINNPFIKSVGNKLGDELLGYYAAADCFVFPSYREGFPNTVLEAGAMGLPSIVTDINGSREIIEEGKNGIIVPPKDREALYNAMEYMLNSTSAREEMSKNARKIIENRYDQGFVRQCLIYFYEEIIPYHV